MSSPLPENVRSALQRGNKIEAIRVLREQTQLSLVEAKRAVESGLMPEMNPPTIHMPGLPTEVAMALTRGDKIKAIKLLRQASGMSLQEAKAIVDEAMAANRALPATRADPARGKTRAESVSVRFLIVLAIIGAAAIWLLGRA